MIACVFAGTPAFAQSELIQMAKDAWGRNQSGQSPKSVPVAADGAVESWGEPMPARGQEVEKRSAARLQARESIPAAEKADSRQPKGQLRREQAADERQLDDRMRDERLTSPAPRGRAVDTRDEDDSKGAKAKVAKKRSADDDYAAAPRRKSTGSREDRYYGGTTVSAREDEPTRRTSCTNVARAWEGAAALADRGEDQRAYDAYLRLLSSCSNEKELIGTIYQAQKNLSKDALNDLMNEPVMESPKLMSAMYALKLQRMYAANKSKDARTALALSREIRQQVLESDDSGALEVSGWLEQRARNSKAAEQLFRASLKVNRDAEGSRQGLVYALLAQNKVEAASREAERLDSSNGDTVRADVLVAQARAALNDKEYAEALKKLDKAERLGLDVDDSVVETRAWALKGLGQNEKAAKLFAGLLQSTPDNQDVQVGLIDTLYAARDDKTLDRLAAQGGNIGTMAKEAVSRRLDDQGRRGDAARMRGEKVEGEKGYASASIGARSKSGEAGQGRLTEVTIPSAEGEVRVGENTKLAIKGTQLKLDDGVNQATGAEVRAKVTTRVAGAEVTAGVGASKVGTDVKPTFEVKGRLDTESGYVEAGVSREPVRDSVRSYAGVNTTIPTAGGGLQNIRVGRAFDTNMYVGGSTLLDQMNRYRLDWSVGGGSVNGQNLYNNGYYRASAALTQDIQSERFSWLNVGPYVSIQSYERDENRFDGTHGGYFSPKSDVGAGLLGRMMTKEGGKSLYKATAQMGYVSRGLYYGNDSGMSLETAAEGAWLITPNIILGAGVSLRTSPGYNDIGFRMGLTIPLESRTKLSGSDLAPFKAQQ
jgi:tetratricopeptide (TPR) repeat protein